MKSQRLIEEIKGKGYSYKKRNINFVLKGIEIAEGYFNPYECPFCGSKKLKRGLGKDYKKMKSANNWGSISCANIKCNKTIFLIYHVWKNEFSNKLSKGDIEYFRNLLNK